MERVAMFPGSFDPMTLGHVDVIERTLPLVDKLYVGIGKNTQKQGLFSLDQRLGWIKAIFKEEDKVYPLAYEGLTVDFCREKEVNFIVRGVRTVKDFEYEKTIADMNGRLAHGLETILLFSSPEYATLASTLVRDILKHGGDVSAFLPKEIMNDLK